MPEQITGRSVEYGGLSDMAKRPRKWLELRCPDCNRKLAEAYGRATVRITCKRCGTLAECRI